MGEIADSMINGEFCACCGAYLEPSEVVYTQQGEEKVKMPSDGSAFGVPVICQSCK